jgi:hypothetical protein
VEGFESVIRGDLNLGGHDIVEVSGYRGEVFGFGRGSQEVEECSEGNRAVEFPRGRSRQDEERRSGGKENAEESVGRDKDKARGGDTNECVGTRMND